MNLGKYILGPVSFLNNTSSQHLNTAEEVSNMPLSFAIPKRVSASILPNGFKSPRERPRFSTYPLAYSSSEYRASSYMEHLLTPISSREEGSKVPRSRARDSQPEADN